MHEQYAAFLHLFGKAYLVLRSPTEGCNPFDNHLLPQQVLYDGAAKDYGEDYAAQLVRFRSYLQQHHPLSKRLLLAAEMPGERIDLSNVIRMEAHAEQSGALELAILDSGVRKPGEDKNKVMYFDLKRQKEGKKANMTVSTHNALFELLQFPLFYETGKGGFFLSSDRDGGVRSTADVKLSLLEYTRAMLFQNRRLHYFGRLCQEWSLVMHSRHVENNLNFQRLLQGKLQQRRRDVGSVSSSPGGTWPW